MKVSTTINAANTNLAAITGRKTVVKSFNGEKSKEPSGNFDTFTMIGDENQKPTNRLSAEKAELIRNLENLSDEEKADVAFNSYLDMQKSIMTALNWRSSELTRFTSLMEDKAYYTDLKNNGGLLTDRGGKYADVLEAASEKGENLADAALEEVQKRIDSMMEVPADNRRVNARLFCTQAELFGIVTGISGDALTVDDDDDTLCKYREGLTEENFIEKTNEAIDLINERKQQLEDMLNEYMGRNPFVKESMNDPYKLLKDDGNPKKSHLAELLQQYYDQVGALRASEPNFELLY